MFKLTKVNKNSEQTYWDLAASLWRTEGIRAEGWQGYIILKPTPQLTKPYYYPEMHTAYWYTRKPRAEGVHVFHTSELQEATK